MGRRLTVLPLGVLGVALIAAACGGDGDDDAPDPLTNPLLATAGITDATEEEAIYYEAVLLSLNEFARRNRQFQQSVVRTPGRASYFQSLIDAGAGTAFAAVLESLERIEPPPGYEADHARLLASYRALDRLDREVLTAAENGDYVGFWLANLELGVVQGLRNLDLASSVCRVVTTGNARQFCDRDALPGGDYGAQLFAISGRLAAEVVGTSQALQGVPESPQITRAERRAINGSVLPDQIAVLEAAIAAIDTLQPPPDLQADHDRFRQFVDETLETTRALLRANNADDQEGLTAGGRAMVQVLCSARDDLSPAIQPAVGLLFATPGIADLCAITADQGS